MNRADCTEASASNLPQANAHMSSPPSPGLASPFALAVGTRCPQRSRIRAAEVRAVNRYGTSSPLRLVGVPKSSRVVPSVSAVRLWRGEQNVACSKYRDIAQCAWLDIDVDFAGDGLPASVDVTCHTLHFEGERPWVTTSVTLRSDRIALNRGRSSELDRVCNYALPGNYVYVTVNGVRSENLYWAEVESDANASAVLRKGDSARGERRTLSGGACSAACRWLDVTVTGLRPNTQYEMWCRTHGLGSFPITQTGYYFGTKGFDFTSDAQGSARITRGCFFNFKSVIWADIDANPDDAFNSIVASSNKIAVTPGTVHRTTGALTREPVWADGSCDGLRGRSDWSETYSVVCGS